MTAHERLTHDFERFRAGLPHQLEDYVLETYGLSLASTYAGHPVRNPFGKASGQLSLSASQVTRDVEAGLGFVVLKTLIAEDESGAQSMSAWAIPATHMKVEPIVGTRPDVAGVPGWTVTWKGRGWSESFAKYLELFDTALTACEAHQTLIVPSVKYHLPRPGESAWRTAEYEYTTRTLYDVWRDHSDGPMPLEKDFSPTLAGDASFSSQREQILGWLDMVPRLIRATSVGTHIRLGLKVFNAAHSDDFQLEMLEHCQQRSSPADYIIYGNRLFDPQREYEGVKGVAYGGPDLSSRNLQVLAQWNRTVPLSATGNIVTGAIAFQYLQRGATSFQIHTLFQLPDTEFAMRGGTRTARALHRLLFHPEHGFLHAFLHQQREYGWKPGMNIDDISAFFAGR